MRTFFVLSLLGLAAADSRIEQQGGCVVDGAEAVSDAIDSSMFIWASVARCGHSGEALKCEIGITSAIQSLNSMFNVIMKAVDKCDDLNTDHKDVALAATDLTKGLAGLAAASGGIMEKCPGAFQGQAHGNNWLHAGSALCVVNLKATAKSLFKVIKRLLKIKKKCDGDDMKCASNAMKVVASFAALGEFLAGTLGHCSHTFVDSDGTVGCAQQISKFIHDTSTVARAGLEVSRAVAAENDEAPARAEAPALPDVVEVQVPRLYDEESKKKEGDDDRLFDKKKGNKDDFSPNMLLAAFLPVTAIVSFVGGRFFATRRGMEQARECQSDHEIE